MPNMGPRKKIGLTKLGKPKYEKIQAILFDKKYWTMKSAILYLKTHGYDYKASEDSPNFHRFRQYNPQKKVAKYITVKKKKIPGIHFIIQLN